MTGSAKRKVLLDTSVVIEPPPQGLLTNVVRQAGRDPRPRRLDLLIAATAVRHGFALATRNAEDLRHRHRVLTVIEVK